MNEPLLRTMSGQIVTRIRDKILSGDYAPGSALLQDSIAAEFGVSKIPVREALVRLRAEGLRSRRRLRLRRVYSQLHRQRLRSRRLPVPTLGLRQHSGMSRRFE